jgi:hypothetical protein
MAGDSNLKIHVPGAAAPLDHSFKRQGLLPQVNARSARSEGNIEPVVDQNTRLGRARLGNRKPREFRERAPAEIFLANLNPIDPRGNRSADGIVDWREIVP